MDGLDAYIEALGSGDFVRAVALTDMSEASSSAREETIAQLYRLTVVDPVEISLKSRQLSDDGSLRARLEIEGTEADFIVLYRQQESGGYTYSLRPCLVDLSTPESTCESFFAALGSAELQQLLMTVDADLIGEEELTELQQLMETLRALVDSGVTIEFANVTLEPLSQGADSFTGILTGDLVIYAYEAERISLSVKVGLIRRGESWLISDMQPNIDLSSSQSAGEAFFRTLVGADSISLLLCLDAEMPEEDIQYVTGLLAEFASLKDAAITVNTVELEVLDSDESNLSGVLRGSFTVSDRSGTEEQTLSFDLEMVCLEGNWLIRGVCAHTDPPVGPDLSTPEHTAESFFEALTGAGFSAVPFRSAIDPELRSKRSPLTSRWSVARGIG